MNIWFSSDWHLGHKNIVLGCTEWENKNACRKFNTLKEHDNTIIDSINKYVKKGDILYFLGDFSMGGKNNVYKYRQMINCSTIHCCIGNHDLHIEKNCTFDNGSRAHDLFTSVNTRIQKKIGKTDFVMDHYAYRTWNKASRGAIMLHGHSHDSLPPYEKLLQIADDPYLYKTGDFYREMDVGLESAKTITGEWRPFHIDEIRSIMEKKNNLDVDHH